MFFKERENVNVSFLLKRIEPTSFSSTLIRFHWFPWCFLSRLTFLQVLRTALGDKSVVCAANRMFIKDCNTCWCNEDGTSYFCTRRVCVGELPEENEDKTEVDLMYMGKRLTNLLILQAFFFLIKKCINILLQ